jgi:hypothetical protein
MTPVRKPRVRLEPTGLAPEQERAAWAKHERESILSDLHSTPAQRFEWLEEMQQAFAELHPPADSDVRPSAPKA